MCPLMVTVVLDEEEGEIKHDTKNMINNMNNKNINNVFIFFIKLYNPPIIYL